MEKPRDWPADAPEIGSTTVTLFAIVDDVPMWATKKTAKRTLIEQTEGTLYAFWKGKYSSHLFVVDRAQAELEVCVGADGSRSADPEAEKFLVWFDKQKACQGFLTDDGHVSRTSPEVSAAKKLTGRLDKRTLAAVAQFALVDDRKPFGWRGNCLSVASLAEHWNQLYAEWQRNGAPRFDKEFVYVSPEEVAAGGD